MLIDANEAKVAADALTFKMPRANQSSWLISQLLYEV